MSIPPPDNTKLCLCPFNYPRHQAAQEAILDRLWESICRVRRAREIL